MTGLTQVLQCGACVVAALIALVIVAVLAVAARTVLALWRGIREMAARDNGGAE